MSLLFEIWPVCFIKEGGPNTQGGEIRLFNWFWSDFCYILVVLSTFKKIISAVIVTVVHSSLNICKKCLF